MTTTETPLHIRQAEGLEKLAAMVREHPEIAEDIDYTLTHGILGMTQFSLSVTDQRERVALWMRLALRHGAKVTKDADDEDFKLLVDLNGVRVKVLANREQVCERKLVGTKTETKTVKDPAKLAEVPEVEVTETVPVYEWECRPLLESTRDGA